MIIRLLDAQKELTYDHVRLAFEASGMSGKVDPPHFLYTWKGLTQNGAFVLGLFPPSSLPLVGAIGGTYYTCPFTARRVGAEIFWYVLPQYRSTRGSYRLLIRFIETLKGGGAEKIVMPHYKTGMSDRLPKLYAKLGFREIDEMWELIV